MTRNFKILMLFFIMSFAVILTLFWRLNQSELHAENQHILLYDKPHKTGSTTIRLALQNYARAYNVSFMPCSHDTSSNYFRIVKILNRQIKVSVIACHSTGYKDFKQTLKSNGNKVLWITSIRNPIHRIIAQYAEYDTQRIRANRGIVNRSMFKEFSEWYPRRNLCTYYGLRDCKSIYEINKLISGMDVIINIADCEDFELKMLYLTKTAIDCEIVNNPKSRQIKCFEGNALNDMLSLVKDEILLYEQLENKRLSSKFNNLSLHGHQYPGLVWKPKFEYYENWRRRSDIVNSIKDAMILCQCY